MYKVNLKAYPKFWIDFAERVNAEIDPSAAMSSHIVKHRISNWYGLNVHIMSSGTVGEVYMVEADYLSFILKYS